MENLKFRRQFLLTKKSPDNIPPSWEQRNISFQEETWHLFSHPDLSITKISNENLTLILIGYIIDPFHPALSNEEILKELILQPNADSLIEKTHILNGRFLLFYISESDFQIFNDATCCRGLYYLIENSTVHCGSTPDIIKHFIGARLTDDKEVIDFLNSEAYINNDHTWVGYDTIYSNLKSLIPNFLLDVKTLSIRRFWPLIPFKKLKPEDIVTECADSLRGYLHGISNRYPVHLGVTAGWDSRMILAASKLLKQNIFYYINIVPNMSDSHVDVKIAENLSRKLGFKLNKIYLKDIEIDSTFNRIFKNNFFRAHDKLLTVFYYGYLNKFDNTVSVSGNLSEGSARYFFRSPLQLNEISGKHFMDIVKFSENSYAEKVLDQWIKEVIPICQEFKIDIFDLYQMEMESTNWCNLSSSEQDITREEMRPFNSRYLIGQFWSIDDKYRFKFNPAIFNMMLKYLWKESLQVPVNPSYKSLIIGILNTLKIDNFVYNLYLRMRYKSLIRKQTHN